MAKNPRDDFAAEALMQAVENFLVTVTDEFTESHTAVYVHQLCALVQVGAGEMGEVCWKQEECVSTKLHTNAADDENAHGC